MARVTVGPFTKGLDCVTNPATLGGQFSPDCRDVRFNHGILESRPGYNILDCEPSYLDGVTQKGLWGLTFDSASSEYGTASPACVIGNSFSVIWDLLPTETADGTYVMWRLYDGANTIAMVSYIVASGLVKFRVNLRNQAGTTYQGDTTAAAAATYGANRNYGILSVASNGVVTLILGGAVQTLTAGSMTGPYESADNFYLSWSGAGSYCSQRAREFVLLNRDIYGPDGYNTLSVTDFSESDRALESYQPIGFPIDSINNDPDILLHYTFTENTGTTVKDWSRYGTDLTLFNTPTWVTSPGGQHLQGRGLGIGIYRPKTGLVYNAIGFTRNGTTSTNTAPEGVVYLDRTDRVWQGVAGQEYYYLGASSIADDTAGSLTGLDPYARHCYLQAGNSFQVHNGVDWARKYVNVWSYIGGTAPATAPILGSSGTGSSGTWGYCYSYYSSTTFTETGRSPVTSITHANKAATTINYFISSDTQFDRVRIYRTITGGAVYYLLVEQAMGTGAGPGYTDTIATNTDVLIVNNPVLPGADASGNAAVKRLYLTFPEYQFGGYATRSQSAIGSIRQVPKAPPTGAAGARGAAASGSLSAGTYYLAYSFYSTATGTETGLSPAFSVTGVLANESIDISNMSLPPYAEYDKIRIYRTKASATSLEWFLDQEIAAATTATVSLSDASRTETIEKRALPPKCQYAVLFGNRVWMAGDPDNPGLLHWSEYGDHQAFPYQNSVAPRGMGVGISALHATEQYLFVSFEDGQCWILPQPGDDPDLILFVPMNLVLFSKFGGCVAHHTSKATNIGTMWLGKDGVYLLQGTTLTRASNRITPMFKLLNGARARYATGVWKSDESLYMVCFPRGFTGKARLNDTWVTYYTDGDAWSFDTLPPCDVMGTIEDSLKNPRFVFVMPTGILCELMTKTMLQEYVNSTEVVRTDGGNLSFPTAATATSPTPFTIVDPGVTANVIYGSGFTAGYAMWLLRTDAHTSALNNYAHRWVMRAGTPFATSGLLYYPMFPSIAADSRVMKAYMGGIKAEWKSPKFDFGYPYSFKTVTASLTGMKLDGDAGNYSVGSALCVKDTSYATFYKYPDANTAVATGNLINAVKLTYDSTTYAFSIQHDWNGIGHARGRSVALLLVNDPPQATYGMAISGVTFIFDMDPEDGQQ